MPILYQDDLMSIGAAEHGLVITFGEKPVSHKIRQPALGAGINLNFETTDESIDVEIRRRKRIKIENT